MNKTNGSVLLATMILMSVFYQGSYTQEKGQVIPRLSRPVLLDGNIMDEEWGSVQILPLTMYQPVFRGALTERTEIRIGYDDTYLYISGRMFDSNPSEIRSNSYTRDEYKGDDLLAVALDTFNDKQTAILFSVNPAGVRFDDFVFNDAEFQGQSEPFNSSLNIFWDGAAVRTEYGWSAEIRIPISSLGFTVVDNNVVMGLSAFRYIARKNERQVFPAIQSSWVFGFVKPSQMQEIRLEGVERTNPAYITPYILGGVESRATLDADGSKYTTLRTTRKELGLDVKYDLTSDLTVDVTVNTDFAQVEADDAQINLTKFSLFFPEKRQFFQERSFLFDFSTSYIDKVFYSRRIGLTNNGSPTRILGGLRMVGSIGEWELGALTMQTDRQDDVPSMNHAVVRTKRTVINPYSYVGGIFTSQLRADDSQNFVYGLDFLYRFTGTDYATVNWVQSFDSNIPRAGTNLLDNTLLRLQLERVTQDGFYYKGYYVRGGRDYNPSLGFLLIENYSEGFIFLQYGWNQSDMSPVKRVTPGAYINQVVGNDDKHWISFEIAQIWNIEFRNGSTLKANFVLNKEDITDTLAFNPTTFVPLGRYNSFNGNIAYSSPPGGLMKVSARFRTGKFYDGTSNVLEVSPAWFVSNHLEIGLNYSYNLVSFPDRQQELTAHIARLRLKVATDAHLSISSFIQYSSEEELIGVNVRSRYNFSEGHDLWFVYNDGLTLNRFQSTPPLPVSMGRVFIMKYQYTIRTV